MIHVKGDYSSEVMIYSYLIGYLIIGVLAIIPCRYLGARRPLTRPEKLFCILLWFELIPTALISIGVHLWPLLMIPKAEREATEAKRLEEEEKERKYFEPEPKDDDIVYRVRRNVYLREQTRKPRESIMPFRLVGLNFTIML